MFYTFGFFMEKDLRYVELFELYQGLLTERQRELFLSHYYYDLSLSEIAVPEGNTRQNVYAMVKKVKLKLDEHESILKLYEKNLSLLSLANEIKGKEATIAERIMDIIGK